MVDDILDNVRLLSYELREQGYEVLTASGGDEALEIVRDQRPDAILLDVMMPHPDGITVCRRLKRDPELQSIPVILVTAKDMGDEVIKGLDVGAHDYITKPFNGKVLSARLRSALRIKEAHDSLAHANKRLVEEIVERRRQEELLRLTQAAVDNAADEVAWIRLDGSFGYVNDQACRALGYSREELLTMTVPDVDPEFTLARLEQLWDEARQGKLVIFESRHRAKSGRIHPVEVRVSHFQLAGEEYMFAFARDITERNRAERALKESEERFRLAANSISDLVYVWDVATDRLEWFGDMDAALGFDSDEISTIAGWVDLIHPDDRQLLDGAVERHRTCADPISEEYRIRRKDGAWCHWVDRGTPVLDDRGLPVKWIGACIDVTKRKQAEDALRRSKERYRVHFQAASDVIFSIGKDFRLRDVSPAVERLLGYKPEELIGRRMRTLQILPAKYFIPALTRLRRVLARERLPPSLWEFVAKDGERRLFEISAAPLVSDGETVGVVCVARDVSESKRAEEELRHREELLRDILEATCDGIVVVDNEDRVLHANSTFVRMWQIPPDLLEARNGRRLLTGSLAQLENPRAMLVKMKRLAGTDEEVSDTLHFKDGRVFEYVSVPFVQNEQTVGRIASFRDVTQRTRAEEQLRQKQEELRQSQKLEAVGQLAGGIAHEFNNLLQAIRGYTQFAKEGLSAEEARYQDLEQVCKATDRAAALTRQLLGFGRRQILERKNVNANDVLADLTKMIRPVIGEHIEQELKLDGDVGTVHADPGELQQAMLNLCLNARDAMPSGGMLLIRTQKIVVAEPIAASEGTVSPGTYAVLSVTDTGCGMTPEIKERIFEPFFTTKEVGKGTGLGLATVYGIVRQHGGTIHLYSEPGQGTTFKIYLPTIDTTPDTAEAGHAASVVGGTETILVAEDEPVVREITVRVLEQAGYRVLEACDGEETLRIFDENREDVELLLLDAVMPKLSGREVFQEIKARMPAVKAVFCTGYDPETAQYCSIAQENVRLIQKPIDSAGLLRSVREVLDADSPPLVPQITA